MEEPFKSDENLKRKLVAATVAVQFGLLFIMYSATPGYVIPLFQITIAKTIVLFLLLWQSLGLALYRYSPIYRHRKFHFALQTVVLIVVFMAPFSLVFLIGPAVPTHPIMAM